MKKYLFADLGCHNITFQYVHTLMSFSCPLRTHTKNTEIGPARPEYQLTGLLPRWVLCVATLVQTLYVHSETWSRRFGTITPTKRTLWTCGLISAEVRICRSICIYKYTIDIYIYIYKYIYIDIIWMIWLQCTFVYMFVSNYFRTTCWSFRRRAYAYMPICNISCIYHVHMPKWCIKCIIASVHAFNQCRMNDARCLYTVNHMS